MTNHAKLGYVSFRTDQTQARIHIGDQNSISMPGVRGFSRPRTRSAVALAAALVLLAVFLIVNQVGELANIASRVTDFGTIYRASQALYSGIDPYAATGNAYFYPPLLAFLFGPLTWLPPAPASLMYFALKMAMLVWTLLACDRLVAGERFTGGGRTLFVFGLVFVASRFWMADLQYGNTNVPIMFLVVAAITWDREGRSWPAGLALALAVSIKLVPAVLCLHFLVLRRWRTLLAFTAGLAGFNLLPWLILPGPWAGAWISYIDAGVAAKLSQRLAQPDNQSLWGLLNRLFPERPLVDLRRGWLLVSVGLGLGAGWVSWAARRRRPLALTAAASLYPLLGLLVSPGSWVVHYTAVLLPMVVLWKLALSGQMPGRLAWPLLALVNLAFTVSGWSRPTVHASITQSWFVTGAVLLMAGLGTWVLAGRRKEGA